MNEEQMAVLRMLAEKKITAEEADQLMEALEGGTSQGTIPTQEISARLSDPSTDELEREIEHLTGEIHRMTGETPQVSGETHQMKMEAKQERLREKQERLREKQEEMRRRHEERRREAAGRHRIHIPPVHSRLRIHTPPVPPVPSIPDIGRIVRDSIPDVGKVVSGALASAGVFTGTLASESQTVSIPEGVRRLMVMCSAGGDLTIRDADETTLRVEGRCSVSSSGEEIRIDAETDDITLSVPASLLSLRALNIGGGDIDCHLHSAGGREIVLHAPGGGDISVSVDEIAESIIVLDAPGGGDVTMRVPEDAAFEITMQAHGGGDIATDLPLETVERTVSSFQGRRNGGGNSRIELSAPGGGDVRLSKLERKIGEE